MLQILVNGCCGQMGQALQRILPDWSDCVSIACGVDLQNRGCAFPVYPDCEHIATDFDVAIDFSVPQGTMEILDYCTVHQKPLIVCTTGLNDGQIQKIETAGNTIPVFRSGNMSLGINLLRALVKQARTFLGDGFDVEIVETHHHRKVDAPSGTAKMLFDAVNAVSERELYPVFGRQESNHRRTSDEVGMHSLRGGTIVGEHEVLFLGEDEAITLKHQAFSKSVFAVGALRAALFIAKQPAGMYDMDDLVAALL